MDERVIHPSHCMPADIGNRVLLAMLRRLVMAAVFHRGVASERRTVIVTTKEAVFRVFVVVCYCRG